VVFTAAGFVQHGRAAASCLAVAVTRRGAAARVTVTRDRGCTGRSIALPDRCGHPRAQPRMMTRMAGGMAAETRTVARATRPRAVAVGQATSGPMMSRLRVDASAAAMWWARQAELGMPARTGAILRGWLRRGTCCGVPQVTPSRSSRDKPEHPGPGSLVSVMFVLVVLREQRYENPRCVFRVAARRCSARASRRQSWVSGSRACRPTRPSA
jgi:hypothetical protein